MPSILLLASNCLARFETELFFRSRAASGYRGSRDVCHDVDFSFLLLFFSTSGVDFSSLLLVFSTSGVDFSFLYFLAPCSTRLLSKLDVATL